MEDEPMSMKEAEETGDSKIMLLTMRRILSVRMDAALPRDTSAIAGKIIDTLRELADLGVGTEEKYSLHKYTDDWDD
jgi:hypothetical protein